MVIPMVMAQNMYMISMAFNRGSESDNTKAPTMPRERRILDDGHNQSGYHCKCHQRDRKAVDKCRGIVGNTVNQINMPAKNANSEQ